MRRKLACSAMLLLLGATLPLLSCGGGAGSSFGSSNPSIQQPPPLFITTTSLPDGVRGVAYNVTLQATGGRPPYQWTALEGLPTGITLSMEGVLSGTTTIAPIGSLTVQVRDTTSQTATRQLSYAFYPPLVLETITLPAGMVGQSYSALVNSSGGKPETRIVTLGTGSSLPPGLSLSSGFVQGTPSASGTFSFVVNIQDGANPPQSTTGTISITINVPPQPQITTTSMPDGISGVPYSVTFAASDGTPPYSWSFTGFSGCCFSISQEGTYSGVPSTHGDRSITVRVTDALNQQATKDFTYHIEKGPVVIVTSELPNGVLNRPYNATIQYAGGSEPFNWALTGNLPPGLQFGVHFIQGVPTAEGTYAFTVEFSDLESSTSRDFTITIVPALGRNDSIASATPLSNGTHRASISPYADPPDLAVGNPDRDYFRLTAPAGAIVEVETFARRQNPNAPNDPLLGSRNPLDTVIEIVDANGQRFQTCNDRADDNPGSLPIPADATPDGFDDPCMNDDIQLGAINDSRLEFRVPGAAGTTVTFYIHVFDWSGMARPDMVYDLVISGAN